MRSILTIIASGILVLLSLIFMPEAEAQSAPQYALKITLEENGEILDTPKIVVEQGKSYFVELSGHADYDFRVMIPADTRVAVQEQFERDLGRWASDFMVVNSQLSFETASLPANIPAEARRVSSSILLRKDGRAIRSDVPMQTRQLKGKDGTKIETLAITVEANPFN